MIRWKRRSGAFCACSRRTCSTSSSTFVVFETKKGTTTKKIARYQQFEAVNELVDRTVSLVGHPVAAQDRTGLIWHTQGSGKSLTMIFAGQKLRRHPALDNPTVLIVVDRRDLKTQLSDDFDACDYPNVEKALGVEDLKRKFRADWRGTLVTTIQAFQNMGDLAPLTRDSVISMVDECHRSQKGNGKESFAMTMRVKLANGFRYGFTGTPIDRTMQKHAPRLRPPDGRRAGALSELLRHPARDSGRSDARGPLPPRQGAVRGGRGDVERRVRGDLHRDGAGGRGGEGFRPAPAIYGGRSWPGTPRVSTPWSSGC